MKLEFDGQKAFGHMRRLAERVAGRLGGTEGEREGAEYIAAELSALGLKVTRQEFEVRTWSLKEQRLEVLEPELGEISAQCVRMTANTPVEGLTGELLILDGGSPEYFGPQMEGRVVVVPGGVPSLHWEAFMRFRPAGLLIVESRLAGPPMRVGFLPEVRSKFGSVPALRISHRDGLRLVKEGARTVRLTVLTEEIAARSLNVIGQLDGELHPDQIVVIGGHHDTVDGTPGASDNTGGSALVLELARVFSRLGSRRTLRFAAWGAEELGLRGSVHYIKELERLDAAQRGEAGFVVGRDRTELERHLLAVNLDVHGAVFGANEAQVLGPPDLAAAVRLLSKEVGMTHKVESAPVSSDATPLSAGGIPSLSFSRVGATTELLHTPLDELDNCSAEALEKSGRFVELFLRRYLADSAVVPFEREIPEGDKKKIREYFEKRLLIDFYRADGANARQE